MFVKNIDLKHFAVIYTAKLNKIKKPK
jgi:hypothetical protein